MFGFGQRPEPLLDPETKYLLRDSIRRIHSMLLGQAAGNQAAGNPIIDAVAGVLSSIRSQPRQTQQQVPAPQQEQRPE